MENNHLYPYQEQYVIKILDPRFEIGRMILPTGSGKGVICREVFYRLITSLENKNNQFLGIVYTPRLMLNYQWIIDFIKYFKGQDYPLNFIFVGSEPLKNDIINKIAGGQENLIKLVNCKFNLRNMTINPSNVMVLENISVVALELNDYVNKI